MRTLITFIAAAAVASGLLTALAQNWPLPTYDADRSYVSERSALMRSVGGQSRALRQALNDGDAEAARASLNLLIEAGQSFPGLMPEGSASRRTADTIWSDWDGFVAASLAMSDAASAVLTSVDAGDFETALAGFGAIGQTCSSCHTAYRN